MAASGFGGFGTGASGRRVRVEGVPFEEFEGLGDLGDLFSMFTGRGGRGRTATPRGTDLETEIKISFEDAMKGTTVPVKIRGAAPCSTCGGSGAEPGTSPSTCPPCGGAGAVDVAPRGF